MGLLSIVKKVAPTIAGIAGGPFGGLAKTALEKAFGGDMPDAKVQEVLASTDPEVLLKLRQAEMDLTKTLRELDIRESELGVEVEKVHAGDRDSARQREISIKDRTPPALAFVVTGGFFGILAWMMAGGLPETGRDALMLMLGALGAAWSSVVAYYFGSSAGSKAKDAALSGRK